MNLSESYCNHLRDQLRDWQRAFRTKHGHLPTRADFDALEHDGTARAKIIHGAYTTLNQATGNSFLKVCFKTCLDFTCVYDFVLLLEVVVLEKIDGRWVVQTVPSLRCCVPTSSDMALVRTGVLILLTSRVLRLPSRHAFDVILTAIASDRPLCPCNRSLPSRSCHQAPTSTRPMKEGPHAVDASIP